MLQDRKVGEVVRIGEHAVTWRDEGDRVHHFARIVENMGVTRAEFQRDALDAHPELVRLHALAYMLGSESPFGILYGTERVNQSLQKPIETYVKQLERESRGHVDLYIETVTEAKSGTMILQEQEYRVFAGAKGSEGVKLVELFTLRVVAESGVSDSHVLVDHVNPDFARLLEIRNSPR